MDKTNRANWVSNIIISSEVIQEQGWWTVARLIGLWSEDVSSMCCCISQASQDDTVLQHRLIGFNCSVLILLLAIYTHLIPPTTGFFNCDDPSIWLPHRGDTFSTKILISVVFLSYLVIVSTSRPCDAITSSDNEADSVYTRDIIWKKPTQVQTRKLIQEQPPLTYHDWNKIEQTFVDLYL